MREVVREAERAQAHVRRGAEHVACRAHPPETRQRQQKEEAPRDEEHVADASEPRRVHVGRAVVQVWHEDPSQVGNHPRQNVLWDDGVSAHVGYQFRYRHNVELRCTDPEHVDAEQDQDDELQRGDWKREATPSAPEDGRIVDWRRAPLIRRRVWDGGLLPSPCTQKVQEHRKDAAESRASEERAERAVGLTAHRGG